MFISFMVQYALFMEIVFFFIILFVFAVIAFASYLISRKVFKAFNNKKSKDAKLISGIAFVASFLIILVVSLYIMDASHVLDSIKFSK